MKRAITIYLMVIVVLSLCWTGCDKCGAKEKKTNDYGFANGTSGMVPYAVGDSFNMVDTLGNTEAFAVMAADISPVEEQCECCPIERRDQLHVSINKGFQANGIQLVLLQDGTLGVKTGAKLRILVGTSAFDILFDTSGTVKAEAPTTLTTINSVLIGSHTYLNVYELRNGVTDSTKANVVWYSTQGGVVRYKLVNGEMWSLP